MGRAILAISGSTATFLPGPLARFAPALSKLLRHLGTQLVDDYHPERHYMRGPGPKYRAKHGTTPKP
jgi:hypothetical protein